MKTKRILTLASLLILISTFSFYSCKKDKNPDTESLTKLAVDETHFSKVDDDAMNDVNSVLSGNGGKSMDALPCNVTVDSSTIVGDTIYYSITFNGLNCHGNLNRVGSAEVRKNVNSHWSDVGATVYVKFINLQVTRVSNNETMIVNGTKKYINVSGKKLSDLGTTATSIVHRVFGTLTATFSDNTTRTWYVARQRTFTGVPSSLILTVDGLGSSNGYSGLVNWGVNRAGEDFYTQITQSIVYKESCGWDPCSGVKVYQIPGDNKKATFTAGYDANDQPLPANSTDCPAKYRIDWEKNGQSGTIYRNL